MKKNERIEEICKFAELIANCDKFRITEPVPKAKYLMKNGYGNIEEFANGFIEWLAEGLTDKNPMKHEDKAVIAMIKCNFQSYTKKYLQGEENE